MGNSKKMSGAEVIGWGKLSRAAATGKARYRDPLAVERGA